MRSILKQPEERAEQGQGGTKEAEVRQHSQPLYIQPAKCPLCGNIAEVGEVTYQMFPGGSFPEICGSCKTKYLEEGGK